jgi:hypothetical protein
VLIGKHHHEEVSMTGAGLGLLTLGLLTQGGVIRNLPIDDPGWELAGKVERVEHLGVRAFRIGTGIATWRNVALEDGTIEFDADLNGLRSFVYLNFRSASDDEHEEIYLRPHKSGLPDAVQYAPVYRGESAWQLYHGPGFTAAPPLPTGGWVHVRLVLAGSRAALFLGSAPEPALVIPRMARPPAAGFIALRGLVPRGSPAPEAAYFANVVVRPGAVPVDFARFPVDEVEPAGAVTRWELSRPFPLDTGVVERLPAAIVAGPWQAVPAEPSSLVVLGRYLARPDGSPRSAVLARLRIRVPGDQVRALDLGYSDDATVFLNGRPIFSARASYSVDAPRRDGVIGLDQATVYLPLRAGENELIVAVADVFGGWGLMGRWRDGSGPETRP